MLDEVKKLVVCLDFTATINVHKFVSVRHKY